MQPYLPILLSVLPLVLHAQHRNCPPKYEFKRIEGKNCPSTPYVRKEWRLLSEKEKDDYIKAVLALRKPTEKDAPSIIDRMAFCHDYLHEKIHGVANFLPWHRAFVLMHEERLQKQNSKVAQPYWNSNYDSQEWTKSPIFDDGAFGGNGDVDSNGEGTCCVKTGRFKGAQVYFPKKQCLRRAFEYQGTFLSTGTVNNLLINSHGDFKTFHSVIESDVHSNPHNSIGGWKWNKARQEWDTLDLTSMFSPNDPIFYLHHCYLDKVWADWQAKFNSANKYAGINKDGSKANSADNLPMFNLPVSKFLHIKDLCYSYLNIPAPQVSEENDSDVQAAPDTDNLINGLFDEKLRRRDGANSILNVVEKAAAARSKRIGKVILPPLIIPCDKTVQVKPAPANLSELSKDHIPLLKLKRPSQVPDRWFKQNGIPLKLAHEIHQRAVNVTNSINDVPGYVSPCALWNRKDLLAKVIADKKRKAHFCAAINGTLIEVNANKENPEKQASEIIAKVKASVVNDVVQKPIAEIYEKVYKVLGAPFYGEDNAANPYRARRRKEIGFDRRTGDLNLIKEALQKKLDEGLVLRNTPAVKPKLSEESLKKISEWQERYLAQNELNEY